MTGSEDVDGETPRFQASALQERRMDHSVCMRPHSSHVPLLLGSLSNIRNPWSNAAMSAKGGSLTLCMQPILPYEWKKWKRR